MRTSLRIVCTCLCVLATFSARAADSAAMEDFTWFSKLGFADVKELPFVRYVYGYSSTGGVAGMKASWGDGWLVAEEAKEFTVRSMNFQLLKLDKDANKGTVGQHRFEPADFRAYAAERLASVKTARGMGGNWGGPAFSPRAATFVLAWMCARKGLDDLASSLYEAAQGQEGTSRRGGDRPFSDASWPLRGQLERDLGEFEIWGILLDFGNLKVSRPELFTRLEAYPGRFPHADYLSLAEGLAANLKTMIAEDGAHPILTPEQIAKLPPAEQAKEWIFRLRDENAEQWSQPGSVHFFFFEDPTAPKSAAHQLAALGDAALPALIDALEDRRLTRSVGYGRNFFFSHHVLAVGDAALQTIEHISGRTFYQSGSVQGTMARDGETSPVKAAVEEWWKVRQAKGPMGELVEATQGGSSQAGRKLLTDFPEAATEPIIAGAVAARGEESRSDFIGLLARLKDARVPELLLREVREGASLQPRAQAAAHLMKLGRMEGVEILAAEWKSIRPSTDSQESMKHEAVIGVLELANTPVGLRALAEDFKARPPMARYKIIEAMLPGRRSFLMMRLHDYGDDPRAPEPKYSVATQAAQEELLGLALDEAGQPTGSASYGFAGGAKLENPRIGDLAAYSMATRWPEKYTYDIKASFVVRDRQRVATLNAYRAARQQPPVPVPPARPEVPAAEAGKIAEVVFAGDPLKSPAPVRALLEKAKGRVFDGAFVLEVRKTFLEACAGEAPPVDHGLVLHASRENDHTGVTLLVARAERRESPRNASRSWRIEAQFSADQHAWTYATENGIFSLEPSAAGKEAIGSMMAKIEALTAEQPFSFTLEIAPDRYGEDNAY